MKKVILFLIALVLATTPTFTLAIAQTAPSASTSERTTAEPKEQGQNGADKAKVKIRPGQLLVRPKNAQQAPKFFDDPSGWIRAQQRFYYEKMATALKKIRATNSITAAWALIFLSFVYGVLHAAGPGHGKAVVSAWLLANEQQLRRGILIAAMAAIVQAITAIVVVTVLIGTVAAIGTKARFIASSLTSISFAMIALVGVYLIYQVLKARGSVFKAKTSSHEGAEHHIHHQDDCPLSDDTHAAHDHSSHHQHDEHDHSHSHDHDHNHDAECGCGHVHMPQASQVSDDWSWRKAFAMAFAVGIRPCSGAILVLLLSSTFGIYWAGIISTFAMAVGTAITVSLAAVLAVTAKNLALKLTGNRSNLLANMMFAVKLLAGIFIATSGALLFWASLPV